MTNWHSICSNWLTPPTTSEPHFNLIEHNWCKYNDHLLAIRQKPSTISWRINGFKAIFWWSGKKTNTAQQMNRLPLIDSSLMVNRLIIFNNLDTSAREMAADVPRSRSLTRLPVASAKRPSFAVLTRTALPNRLNVDPFQCIFCKLFEIVTNNQVNKWKVESVTGPVQFYCILAHLICKIL